MEVAWAPRESVAGKFAACPLGVILHGSRSGRRWSLAEEYASTVRYAASGAGGLGWNATVGDRAVCQHVPLDSWGWNARAASPRYLAVEFAQPTASYAVTDGQVEAFARWFRLAREAWPRLPAHFLTHAEMEAMGATGARDGKTDVFPVGDPRADELRRLLLAAL